MANFGEYWWIGSTLLVSLIDLFFFTLVSLSCALGKLNIINKSNKTYSKRYVASWKEEGVTNDGVWIIITTKIFVYDANLMAKVNSTHQSQN